jgi:hypothetical protein
MTCTILYMKRYFKRYVEREKEVEMKGKRDVHTAQLLLCSVMKLICYL